MNGFTTSDFELKINVEVIKSEIPGLHPNLLCIYESRIRNLLII